MPDPRIGRCMPISEVFAATAVWMEAEVVAADVPGSVEALVVALALVVIGVEL